MSHDPIRRPPDPDRDRDQRDYWPDLGQRDTDGLTLKVWAVIVVGLAVLVAAYSWCV
jgi:hypothetical protein